MGKMITKLIGIVDSVATPPHAQTGIVTAETELGEQTGTVDTVDNTGPGSELDEMDLPESNHQPEDKTGMEKPAISDLVTIAEEFNAAFNIALYELDSSRKQIKEHSTRIDELNESIDGINTTLSAEVNRGHRQEEEYRLETEVLNKKIQDIESERDRLNQHVSDYEDKLNTRAEEVTQLSSQLENLTSTLDQRTMEGQRAQEEFERERSLQTGKLEELQVLFDNADRQLKVQQQELDGRDSVITHISRQVDSMASDLDFQFEEIDQQDEAYNQETTRLCADILELKNDIQTRDKQLEQQHKALESKDKEVAWQNDHISELKDNIDVQSEAMQKLSESHANECAELNAQISDISSEIQTYQATHNDLVTHANKLENLNHALHESSISENELHKKILNEKDSEIASLRAKVESTRNLPSGLVEDATPTEDLHSELRALESRLKGAEELQHKFEERARLADSLEAEVNELRTALQNATDSNLQTADDTNTTIDSLKSEIEKLESLLSASEEKHEQLQSALPGASLEHNPGDSDALLPAQDSELISTATDRVQFVSRLNTLLAEQLDSEKNQTVMYLLLDNFMHIRDEIGIMNSEHVINEITDFIASFCRSDELISRFGDCSFIILSCNESSEETKEKAENICSAIENKIFEASGHSVITSASIGICKVRKNDACAEEIISRADLACEVARSSGGNQVILNSTVADELITMKSGGEHQAVVSKILDENRIIIYYQPISCLKDIPGNHYETLIRIVDESGDIILPGEFVSMAKDSGQSMDIDLYVIENIMKMLSENQDQELTLFIKLTSQTVSDSDFPIWLIGKIKEYQINPGQLVFEIAETTMQNNLKNMSMLSKSLNTIGCKLAIEHYRMSTQPQHLLHIHTDYLKIDSGLIESLSRKGKSFSKVVSIMDVARKHNYITIAEGVENPASLAILWELGVDLAQGYFIQAPDGARHYDFNGEGSDSKPKKDNKAAFTID